MEVSDNHRRAQEYLDNLDKLTIDELSDAMTYKWFRLNTLYHIKDKDGKKVLFQCNGEQEAFYLGMHGRDIILKARQLGFTTFKMIHDLDECLFTADFSAGCICHNLEDAKDIYRNKIRYAYQQITDDQKRLISDMGYELPVPSNDKDNGYVFSNGSSIKVSTSYRGGTLQSLHISEFGKICKKYPEKAKEIVTGAFEAVGIGNWITIESTAEGREGYFYEYSIQAKKLKALGNDLNNLEFCFHFFPWWLRDEYSLNGAIAPALIEYFDELEAKHDISLNNGQKSWYSTKWRILGEDMKREYPSTPEEAFQQSIEGAYYARQFADIYKDKRICDLSELGNDSPVSVVCDIGIGDSTALWFFMEVGKEVHLVHYHENSGESLGYYIKYIEDLLEDNGWSLGKAWGPHDMNNREFASKGKTRRELAREGVEYMGVKYSLNFDIVPKLSIDDGIQLVRSLLPKCVFDSDATEDGVKALESYRKEWDAKKGCFKNNPLHDWASHGADAFRYLAVIQSQRKPVTNVQVHF